MSYNICQLYIYQIKGELVKEYDVTKKNCPTVSVQRRVEHQILTIAAEASVKGTKHLTRKLTSEELKTQDEVFNGPRFSMVRRNSKWMKMSPVKSKDKTRKALSYSSSSEDNSAELPNLS